MKIRFIDLFGGIGGFRYGLEKVSKRFKCVYYCDIDKYAVETYNKNFGEKHETSDITKINATDLPDFDLICGGFPCQSFSIAGKRKGFTDTRGTLFFEICRITSEKKPRMLFLENVKGLLSHDNGETFRVILESLDELGYNVEWQVLNSKNFGVPQNRERVFIIGHLRESGGRTVFPIREINTELDSVSGQRGQLMVERFPLKFMTRNQKNIEGDYAFTVDGANTGGVIVHSMQPRSPDRPSLKYSSGGSVPLNRKDGYTYCLDSGNCQAVELPIMNTLTEATGNRAGSSKEFLKSVDNIKKTTGQIRRLTPVECERLQGFPDNWTDGVSDTQRYKQLGNAVTVNVIQAIGERILEVW